MASPPKRTFRPALTANQPGGSQILDRNLQAISAALDDISQQAGVSKITSSDGSISVTTSGPTTTITVNGSPDNVGALPPNTLFGNPTDATASGTAIGLGTVSGVLQYVHGSPDTLGIYAAAANRIPFGSGSNGQLTDDPRLQFNGVSVETSQAEVQTYNDDGATDATAAVRLGSDSSFVNSVALMMWGTSHGVSGALGGNSGLLELSSNNGDVIGRLAISNYGGGDIYFTSGNSRTTNVRILGAGGHVQINDLAAGGMVKAASSTGQLGIATAGTDYVQTVSVTSPIVNTGTSANPNIGLQAPATSLLGNHTGSTANAEAIGLGNGLGFTTPAPGVNQIENTSALFSLTAVTPLGFDGVHTLKLNDGINVNGAGLASNVALVVGHTNTANRDRVQFFLGGGSSPDNPDNALFQISATGTTIPAGRTTGIWATQRIGALTYTGTSSPAITEASSLYIDAAPTLSGATGSTYALHVAAGSVRVNALAGPARVTTDANGVLVASTGPASATLIYNYSLAGFTGLGKTNAGIMAGATQSYNSGQGPLLMSTSGASTSTTEYGLGVVATKVTVRANFVRNDLSSGTGTMQWNVTRNGAATSVTLFVTEGAGAQGPGTLTATGTIAGGAATDTYGLEFTNGTGATGGALTGTVALTVSAV